MWQSKTFSKSLFTAVSALALCGIYSGTAKADALNTPIITGQTSASATQAACQWTQVENAGSYAIRYSANGGLTWSNPITNISDCSYTFPLLGAGSSYYVQVSAYPTLKGTLHGDTESTWSQPFEIVTAPSSSLTGANMKQTSASTTTATFSWKAISGATGYMISKHSALVNTPLSATFDTTYKVTGLSADQTYEYAIQPFRASASGFVAIGNATWNGDTIKVSTLSKKPGKFSIANWWGNVDDISFSYPDTNSDGYRTQVYNEKGKLIDDSSSKWQTHFINNKFPFGCYRKVKVSTYRTFDNKKHYSAARTQNYIFQPEVNLTRKNGKLQLNWSKVPKAEKYEIYVSYSEKSGYQKVATVSNKKTSYKLSTFNGRKIRTTTTYYVYVKPVHKGATSVCSYNWFI